MPLLNQRPSTLPPLSYREFRLQWTGVNKKAPTQETISPNRSEDYGDKSELSEEWNYLHKILGGPDSQILHEPLEHFPGVFPTNAGLSLRGIKKAYTLIIREKKKPLIYFGPKRYEPNFDNVDVLDTDNRKKEVKYGPVEKAREFDYDGSEPKAERGMELEYETPFPYVGEPMSAVQTIFAPYL